MDLDWYKKISALPLVNSASWAITTTLSPAPAANVRLFGLPSSIFYSRPTPVRESTRHIMAKIHLLYLEDPCSGSNRIVDYLVSEGIPISRSVAKPHVTHGLIRDLPVAPNRHPT